MQDRFSNYRIFDGRLFPSISTNDQNTEQEEITTNDEHSHDSISESLNTFNGRLSPSARSTNDSNDFSYYSTNQASGSSYTALSTENASESDFPNSEYSYGNISLSDNADSEIETNDTLSASSRSQHVFDYRFNEALLDREDPFFRNFYNFNFYNRDDLYDSVQIETPEQIQNMSNAVCVDRLQFYTDAIRFMSSLEDQDENDRVFIEQLNEASGRLEAALTTRLGVQINDASNESSSNNGL